MDLKDTIEVKSGLYITQIVKMPDGKTVTMLQPNPNLTEEEFLSKDPYAELLEEASKKENFDKAVTTQKMVNEYLMSNNRPTITEKRAKEGKRDILGIVTSDYKAVLQEIVRNYTTKNNIDLYKNNEKKSGIMGVISKKEQAIIDILLENYKAYNKDDSLEHNSSMTR